MKFFLLKFILIGICIFVVAETFILFIDSKQNGFFTLSVHHNIASVNEDKSIEILLNANENYLGSTAIPISSIGKGNVSFKIKEKNANSWYQQNTYNIEAFNLLPLYPFGFPVVTNSKNKQYIIRIDPVNSAQVHLRGSEVQAKHVYPKTEITSSLNSFAEFIIKKYYYLSHGGQIFFYSFLCAFLILKPRLLFPFIRKIGKRLLSALVFLPILLFIILPVFLLTHNILYAKNIVEWIWIVFAVLILQASFKSIKNFLANKNDKDIKKHILICFFGLSLVAVVIAALNKTYMFGGDDSRTFYLYPIEFFINHTSHVGPDGAVSSLINFLPPTSIAAFSILIIILKSIFFIFNLQMILFIFNIIGGIVFFYVLIDYLLPGKHLTSFLAKVLGSLLYVFSIFNFYTLFNSQLIAMYLISMFPLSMYLYVKGIKEGKFYLIALVAVIWSIFSFLVVSLPWFLAGFIAFLPILFWFFWKQKKRFLLYNCLLLLLLLLLNTYWIYTVSFSFISASSISDNSAIVSDSFRMQHAEGIIATTEINKVFFPLVNLYHYDIQANFKWPYFPIFTSWYLNLLPLNALFILLVLLTGIKMGKSPLKGIYVASVFGLLISIYFFTVNIGSNGIKLFLFLNDYIPGFVMFRNMFDKFGFAIAISMALSISVCLQYFLSNEKKHWVKIGIVSVFFFLILLNAKPFLLNEFYSVPVWTTKNTYNTITGFNQDYLNLVQYIKEHDNPSRYLWLPINNGNISQIQDEKKPNHYYSGVSPLLFLSGKNDYSGVTSFDRYSKEIATDIYKRKYSQLGELYRRFNVRYIIVNHTITPDIRQSYICGEKICDAQDERYKKAFLGKKIKDFGSRYTLYEINSKYINDKIYLQDGKGKITYKKITSDEYTINLSHINQNARIIFLDPYFTNWELSTLKNDPLKGSEHTKIFNYANAWKINTDELKATLPKSEYKQNSDGTIDISLKLRFQKSILYPIAIIISIITYIGILGYALTILILRIFKSKK